MAAVNLFDMAKIGAKASACPHVVQLAPDTVFAVVDLETTGLSPAASRVVEIAVDRVTLSGEHLGGFSSLVAAPGSPGPTHVHGITAQMLRGAPTFKELAAVIVEHLDSAVVVAHNATFEAGFLAAEFARAGVALPQLRALCTMRTARLLKGRFDNHKLGHVCDRLGVQLRDAHTAAGDTTATSQVLVRLLAELEFPDLGFEAPGGALPELERTAEPYPRRRVAEPRQRPRLVVRSGSTPGFTRLPGEWDPHVLSPRSTAPAALSDDPGFAASPALSPALPTTLKPAASTPAACTAAPGGAVNAQLPLPRPRRAGQAGDRRAASPTLLTFCGAGGSTHEDPDATRAVSAVHLSTSEPAAEPPEGLAWLCAAVVDALQRGWRPPVPGMDTTRADDLVAAVQSVPARLTGAEFDSELESRFAALVADRWPQLAGFVAHQVSVDAISAGGADRFADFVVAAPWASPVVVELDGAQHVTSGKLDARRDDDLAAAGVDTLRVRFGDDIALERLCDVFDALAEAAPEPLGSEVWADTQAVRVVFAAHVAAASGFVSGSRWVFDVAHDVAFDPTAVASAMSIAAMFDELFGLGAAPDEVWFNTTCVVKRGSRYDTVVGSDARERPEPTAQLGVFVGDAVEPVSPLPWVRVVRSREPGSPLPLPTRRSRLPVEEGVGDEALDAAAQMLLGLPGLRDLQRVALRKTMSGSDAVVVLPTGFGKSAVFQLAGLLWGGVCVVVDPINALIDDQCRRMEDLGVDRFVGLSSSRQSDAPTRARVARQLESGWARFVFCSPERFTVPSFKKLLTQVSASQQVSLLVVDEAHCVSEWGHDFRTSYLGLADQMRACTVSDPPPLAAFTGTASPAVLRDILTYLSVRGDNPVVRPESFSRPNLRFGVDRRRGDRAARLSRLLTEVVPADVGLTPDVLFSDASVASGIVFCPHVNGEHGVDQLAGEVTEVLRAHGLSPRVAVYAGGRPKGRSVQGWADERAAAARAFTSGELDVLVATKSFGMGVDADHVRFTIHAGIPSSVEAFAQEAGRAGRNPALPASCQLLVDLPSLSAVHRRLAPTPHSTRPNDDLERQLFFHRRTHPGRGVENRVAVELWGDLCSEVAAAGGSPREVSVPMSTASASASLRLRALHRLSVLGLVRSHSVAYGSGALNIAPAYPTLDELDAAFLEFVASTAPSQLLRFRSRLRDISTEPARRAAALISAVVEVAYEVIEPARRQALSVMASLALSASTAEEFTARLNEYLVDGPLPSSLLGLCDTQDPSPQELLAVLVSSLPCSNDEWRAAAKLVSTAHPEHVVSSLAVAVVCAMTFEEPAKFYAATRRFLATACDIYPVEVVALLNGWLIQAARHRGRAATSSVVPWMAWRAQGLPLEATRAWSDEVFDAVDVAHPLELEVALTVSLSATANLLDEFTSTGHGR